MTRSSGTSPFMPFVSPRSARALLVLACAALPALAAAQYKSVGPDGRVTYSDQPPSPTSRVLEEKKAGPASAAAGLPFDVQQATSRYPVVLYTANRCAPCDDARSYLRGRGVPFTEKTVNTDDDLKLFKQQSPDGTAPVVSVGSRKMVGFLQGNLATLLDDAGYPATNKLPRDYQAQAPTSLAPTPRNEAPQASTTTAPPPSGPPPAAAPPPPANAPPGFRF